MADDVIKEIDDEIRGNKVMIYMKGTPSFPQCGFSAATIEIFEELGKPFETVDVLSSPAKREAIKRYSNWPTIPQVYVNGKFVGGCDIVRELHATRRAPEDRRLGVRIVAVGRGTPRCAGVCSDRRCALRSAPARCVRYRFSSAAARSAIRSSASSMPTE